MNKPNKEIVEEYNIIRVFATLLVVIGHSGYISPMTKYGGISMGEYSVPVAQTAIDMLIRLIYTFHMPLFFSLSGALFYRKIANDGYKNAKDLIYNKTKRLLIPFILCTLLWVIPLKAVAGYWSHSYNVFHDIIEGQILLLGNTHMWFLWVLFVITLLSYLLRNEEIIRIIVAIVMFIIGGAMKYHTSLALIEFY